mgnify:FL=1
MCQTKQFINGEIIVDDIPQDMAGQAGMPPSPLMQPSASAPPPEPIVVPPSEGIQLDDRDNEQPVGLEYPAFIGKQEVANADQ